MVHPTTETPSLTSTTTVDVSSHEASDLAEEVVKQQISVATTVLLQAVDVLDKHLTSDEQLSVQSKHLPGSTIGAVNSFC